MKGRKCLKYDTKNNLKIFKDINSEFRNWNKSLAGWIKGNLYLTHYSNITTEKEILQTARKWNL